MTGGEVQMGIARRFEDSSLQFRCPQCGRYLGIHPDGFYDCEVKCDESERDMHAVAPFCDERCANRFHGRAAA